MIDLQFDPVVSIFDDSEMFTRYQCRIKFTGIVIGGVPQKPEIIESWLRQRIVGGDEELRLMVLGTLEDLGIEVPSDATREDIAEAAKKIAATRNGNTFRRDDGGLFLADYQIKAMLKEATNILFAGEKWGATRKGPKGYLAERVFVENQRAHLGRLEPDGTHMQIGHIVGPQGPRSTLTYYDYCVQPETSFTFASLKDCIKPNQWEEILMECQRLGLGALRSLSHGQFKVIAFDRLPNKSTGLH